MHIANMKTYHFDWTQFSTPEEAKDAMRAAMRSDPDVFVFHRLPLDQWDLVRQAYESGAEVVLTPYPDRDVTIGAMK